ncbi:MAG: histidine phosphatase family protein [Caldilineaceae bacterium]|nr:histidine phosphatase family protein [Caldilineaceae bacterium]
MQLYLIRHAHTQARTDVDAATWTLSAQGQQQALALAQAAFWPHVDRIVLSREAKTRLTIEPVLAKFKPPIVTDGRFDELRRGGWIADYSAHVAQAFAAPQIPAGAWESAADARQRFVSGIDALIDTYPHETIALVGHGLTLSLYRAYLLGQPTVKLADWQNLPFAAVAHVAPKRHQLLSDFRPVG